MGSTGPWKWLCVGGLLAGCYGQSSLDLPVGASGSAPGVDAQADPTVQLPPGTDACLASPLEPGAAPLRRLSRTEYNNAVRDLLGDTRDQANHFPPDSQALGFDNNAEALTVSPVLTESYFNAAESLAASVSLAKVLPCDPVKAGEQSCAEQFVDNFGRRIYRAPLESDDRAGLLGLYGWSRQQGDDFLGALRLVLTAMLQSPRFLYRAEVDPALDGAVRKLTPYELASRLSFTLLGTTPDVALLDAAEGGELADAAGVARWARKLLLDARAHEVVQNFTHQWLKRGTLEQAAKDASAFPTFEGLRPSMKAETDRFLESVFWEEADASKLWSAPFTFVDGPLAAHYGIFGPTGSTLTKVALDPTQRAGFLTQASFLTAIAGPLETQPVQRGKFVREQLLCQQLQPPPPNVPAPPDLGSTASMRDRLAQHTQSAACSGCHLLMDPIGLGFERYDAIGAYHPTNDQGPIDDSGEVLSAGDAEGKFLGAAALSVQLAPSKIVDHCLTTQWFRFALGRADAPADKCGVQRLELAFEQAHLDPRELLVALTQTDAFLFRRATP